MRELTFREVIANIKKGEVWESENNSCDVRIKNVKDGIEIRDFTGNRLGFLSDDWKFKLKRKEYTFLEAFKAYEEGENIESLESGCKFTKIEGLFTSKEIRGKWYIGD